MREVFVYGNLKQRIWMRNENASLNDATANQSVLVYLKKIWEKLLLLKCRSMMLTILPDSTT